MKGQEPVSVGGSDGAEMDDTAISQDDVDLRPGEVGTVGHVTRHIRP